MADGDPVIQGTVNTTQSATRLVNGAAAGDGTGLYVFGGEVAFGQGLYVVGHGAGQAGGQFYSYEGDAVQARALPGSQDGAGMRGISYATNGVGVHGLSRDFVSGAPGNGYGVWGEGRIGTVGVSSKDGGTV